MKAFLKFILLVLLISLGLGLSEKWYIMFYLGKYWEHASLFSTLLFGVVVPITTIYLFVLAFRKVINLKNQ